MRSRAVVVAAVLASALVSGGWLMQAGVGTATAPARVPARLLDQVMTRIERDYVDTVTMEQLYRKAVDGLLLELHDPHSVFLTPDRLARLSESTTGRYAGVGIQIDVRDGWITVVTPLPGTPAEKAGLVTGDKLVEIDGRSTRGWASDEALRALRGTPGSTVRVVAERPGSTTRLPVTLRREEIHFRSVQHAILLRDGVGYVDLTVFSEDSGDELRAAIDSLRGVGMQSLIFDLRGDPGGLLDQGVAVSDLFLDTGQRIVSMRGRTREVDRDYADRFPQQWPDLRLVVLVDSSSASAAEIVAGALQDHDRALLVGTATYGKGSAQSLFRMPEGGALKLTTALWYTPSGRSISRLHANADDDDGEAPAPLDERPPRPRYRTDAGRTVLGGGGIMPDVEVEDTTGASLEHALQAALGRHVADFRDVLTAAALDLKASGAVQSPDFTVTPAMRADLYGRLRRRNVVLPRTLWDEAGPLIDRLFGYQAARYVFGPRFEFERTTRDDPAINVALRLLQGVSTQQELLRRAGEK